MESTDLVTTDNFPEPKPRKRGLARKKSQIEAKLQGLEAAAIAYVQMENGAYKYGENVRRRYNEDGTPDVNKRELMRRAGYAPGSLDHFDEYLGDCQPFWELVELHRLRRTDPMFRREQESQLWQALGGEALRNLYERLFYSPHSMSTEQHLKIVKLILDAGITLNKLGGPAPEKSKGLLDTLDPASRTKAMKGYEESLRAELEQVQALKMAHSAVDRTEQS